MRSFLRAVPCLVALIGRLPRRAHARPAMLLGSVLLLVLTALLYGSRAPVHADDPPWVALAGDAVVGQFPPSITPPVRPLNTVTFFGDGTAELPPDLAFLSGSVETEAPTAPAALSQNSRTMEAVIAAMRELGVADPDIRTTGLNVFPVYSQPSPPVCGPAPTPPPGVRVTPPVPCGTPQPPTIIGYRATNGIRVRTTDLSKVGDIIQAQVDAGINNFTGIQYGLQNPEQLRILALQAAFADAFAQARAASEAVGVPLGPVVNFSVQFTNAPPVPGVATAAPARTAIPIAAPPALPPVLPGPFSAQTRVSVTFVIPSPPTE